MVLIYLNMNRRGQAELGHMEPPVNLSRLAGLCSNSGGCSYRGLPGQSEMGGGGYSRELICGFHATILFVSALTPACPSAVLVYLPVCSPACAKCHLPSVWFSGPDRLPIYGLKMAQHSKLSRTANIYLGRYSLSMTASCECFTCPRRLRLRVLRGCLYHENVLDQETNGRQTSNGVRL